jgi:hypothetical protein
MVVNQCFLFNLLIHGVQFRDDTLLVILCLYCLILHGFRHSGKRPVRPVPKLFSLISTYNEHELVYSLNATILEKEFNNAISDYLLFLLFPKYPLKAAFGSFFPKSLLFLPLLSHFLSLSLSLAKRPNLFHFILFSLSLLSWVSLAGFLFPAESSFL